MHVEGVQVFKNLHVEDVGDDAVDLDRPDQAGEEELFQQVGLHLVGSDQMDEIRWIRSDRSDQVNRQNKLLSGNRKCPTHLERPEGRQVEQESGKSVFVPTMVPEGGEHSVGERLHLGVRL